MRMEEVKISENENFVHSVQFDWLHVNVQKLETFYSSLTQFVPRIHALKKARF